MREDSRLRREVIRRRKAVERGKSFLAKVRAKHEHARDLDSGDVIDELDLLIKALEETL